MTVTWTAPSNNVVMGYLVSFTPKDINPISVGRDIMTTPITGLTPGRLYNVTVKTRVTYLQGRDEMTDTLSAAPNRTTPASVLDLDMQTYRAAPNITIVFPKAAGDADRYLVTLSGQDRDNYTQQHRPVNTGQGLISVVFTGVVSAVSYDLNIVTQSGNIQSSPYTTVIHVLAPRAEKVNNLKLFDNTSRSVAVEWSRPLKPNGYIYEYIVDVRTHPVCVKRIIINCTECNRDMVNITETAIECQTNMTVAITEADIENTAHVIQYNITGLNPDTAYSIDVVAVNEKGRGRPGQVNINTSMEGAGDPTNFTAESKSSSEITLTWDPPQPRPGVTQYNITVYEKQENESYNTFNIIPVAGWETNTYTITNLSSYWFYKFDIVAQTSEGASAIVRSGPERTMESEPTRVVGLKIVKVLGVFNEVQVSWKCPNQKDGRNGEIVNANLNYFTNQQSIYVEPVRGNKNYTNNGDCTWNVKVTVTTEFKYVFEVRLYNTRFAGLVDSVSVDIVGGAPRQSVVSESVRKGGATEETVSLNICPRCLYDRTNGQVNVTGLIVCKKGGSCGEPRTRRSTTSAADYNKFLNWNAAGQNSFNVDYRATKQDWLAGKERDSNFHFTLGNEDCSGNTKNVFCNGKLPTGQTFIVYAFSCTNHGCTTSNRIVITTGKQQVPVAAVVGGFVAAVVVILFVTGIFIILLRRKTHKKSSKRSRDEVHARDEVRPEQDDIYDQIPDCQVVTVDSSHSNEGYVNYASGHSTRRTDNTYDALATYQNADAHVYGRIIIETRFK